MGHHAALSAFMDSIHKCFPSRRVESFWQVYIYITKNKLSAKLENRLTYSVTGDRPISSDRMKSVGTGGK